MTPPKTMKTAKAVTQKIDWKRVVDLAATIVDQYDTGVTLRQLFYRLVAAHELPNSTNAYKGLSRHTAVARRAGWFPPLIDNGRSIHRYRSFDDTIEARDWLKAIYRRDRTEGQEWSIYIGVEKAGIVQQLQAWFGDFGVPILALGGYSSQTYVDDIAEDARAQGRKVVLLYAGDFDPSGEDIDRDLIARAGCFDKVVRVALSPEQVIEYELPPQPGKESDSRAAAFEARHGMLVQVELDAVPPDTLHELYREAFDRYFDHEVWEELVEEERIERASL